MATYKQDLNLPSHGRRAKADNAGTIRVHITRGEGLMLYMDPQAFDYYLNIDTQNGTYHATIEVEKGLPPKKEVTSIEPRTATPTQQRRRFSSATTWWIPAPVSSPRLCLPSASGFLGSKPATVT